MVNIVREHLVIALSLGAGVLLLIGALVIIERAPVPPGEQAQIWSGVGNAPVAPTYAGTPVFSNLQEPTMSGDSPSFLPIAPKPSLGEQSATGNDTDLASLLASLSSSGNSSVTVRSGTPDTGVGYEFIPQGLISTTSFAVHRTDTVQALYDYGNEVGSYVQSYEHANAGAAIILKNQIEDRQDPAKGQAVKDLGASLGKIGMSMQRMSEVPSSLGSLHTNLANSYIDAGKKLSAVPDAEGDQAFIAAIEAYDASADSLAQNFSALATFFSVSQVTFTSSDPGSVFSFTPGGAL